MTYKSENIQNLVTVVKALLSDIRANKEVIEACWHICFIKTIDDLL